MTACLVIQVRREYPDLRVPQDHLDHRALSDILGAEASRDLKEQEVPLARRETREKMASQVSRVTRAPRVTGALEVKLDHVAKKDLKAPRAVLEHLVTLDLPVHLVKRVKWVSLASLGTLDGWDRRDPVVLRDPKADLGNQERGVLQASLEDVVRGANEERQEVVGLQDHLGQLE